MLQQQSKFDRWLPADDSIKIPMLSAIAENIFSPACIYE
jgi:hypothetical protein